jgi:hypothetical protein
MRLRYSCNGRTHTGRVYPISYFFAPGDHRTPPVLPIALAPKRTRVRALPTYLHT